MKNLTRTRLLTLASCTVVALTGGLLVGTAPAQAVPGVRIVSSGQSASNSNSPRRMEAFCSTTERVIGGGGYIQELGGSHKPTLTELRPIDGARDSYRVTA